LQGQQQIETPLPGRPVSAAQVRDGLLRRGLNQYALMLGIADDERPPAVQLFDGEIEAVDRRIDRDERRGPAIIPARGNRAAPFPEAEDRCAILRADCQHTKHGGSVASSQLADLGCIRRDHWFATMIAFVESVVLQRFPFILDHSVIQYERETL
jgi:hypothetical protein